jgi:hypothetical protein
MSGQPRIESFLESKIAGSITEVLGQTVTDTPGFDR